MDRQILLENISRYVDFPHSTLTEAECLVNIAKVSGCGLLLDISNIYINALNFNFSAEDYLAAIPADFIQEFHLGGFTQIELENESIILDTHDQPIVPAVWKLYQHAIELFGVKPTIIEWDKNLPPIENLYSEAYRAEQLMRAAHGLTN